MNKRKTTYFFLLLFTLLSVGSATVQAQVSGSSRLDVAAFPIPCTVVDLIKLDTPCERTLLTFDIESLLNLNITVSGVIFQTDAAIGIAGPEHLILQGIANLGAVTLHPELWFAVPFESVIDANSQPNIVVIPPGAVMFVKKRFTTEMNMAGIMINNLAMFEDVNFPSPSANFVPLTYPVQSQSFAFGDIITLQGQTVSGLSITASTALCATRATNSVKKFSASGSVNPTCADPRVPITFDFQTVSVGGISIGGIQASASMNFVPLQGMQLSVGTSTRLFNIATFSTSYSFATATGLNVNSGLSASLKSDPLNIGLSFDGQFQLRSANLSFSSTQTLGPSRLSFTSDASLSGGGGLTSLRFATALTQGTFSANQAVSFTRQAITPAPDPTFALRFASLTSNVSVRFSPASITMNVAFGRKGLTRFAIITGVVF